jgi:septal ring factor EnvC (AmiA/AmiB activator)
LSDASGLSPKKLEYLLGGYLGTAGLYALALSDMLVRQLEGKPPGPSLRADDLPVVKAFYRVDPARATVFESDLYKMRAEVDAIAKSIKASAKDNPEEAARLQTTEKDKLAVRNMVVNAAKSITTLNRQRDQIYADKTMTPDEKRKQVDELQRKKNALAKQVAEHPMVKAAF